MVRTYEFPDAEEHFDAGGAQPTTVSDGAGGTFTAVIGARTPNADGKGTLVFFWHNDRFVGWDNDVEAFVTRSLVASGVGRFDVTYSNYAAEDAACCPSKPRVTITFRWNGSRFSPTTPIPLGVYDLDKNSYAHPLTVVLQQSRPSFVWANHTLIISSYALGGAVIGMTSDQAARAAGVSSFTAVGDGVLVPSGHDSDNPHLYLGNFAGQPASKLQGSFSCVGASLNDARPATQDVVTTEGLRLGDPATRVRDIYGASAIYVPLPSTGGLDPHAGYVVNEGAFDLVFKLDSTGSRVIAIAGGLAPMTPSECNG